MVAIPQVSYALVPPPAFAGMIADSGFHDVESAIAEVALDCGLGVMKGTTGGVTPQVKLPTSAGDLAFLKGVTIYQAIKEPTGNANRYAAGDPLGCLTQGRIWVQIDATVGAVMVDEGPVYWVFTGANAGKFRGDAGSGPAAVLVPNAKCKVGGTAGGVAEIKINLP